MNEEPEVLLAEHRIVPREQDEFVPSDIDVRRRRLERINRRDRGDREILKHRVEDVLRLLDAAVQLFGDSMDGFEIVVARDIHENVTGALLPVEGMDAVRVGVTRTTDILLLRGGTSHRTNQHTTHNGTPHLLADEPD